MYLFNTAKAWISGGQVCGDWKEERILPFYHMPFVFVAVTNIFWHIVQHNTIWCVRVPPYIWIHGMAGNWHILSPVGNNNKRTVVKHRNQHHGYWFRCPEFQVIFLLKLFTCTSSSYSWYLASHLLFWDTWGICSRVLGDSREGSKDNTENNSPYSQWTFFSSEIYAG